MGNCCSIFLINAIVTPNFLTYNNIINILYHSAILSMLVLAEGLVLINLGILTLSIDAILAFAPGIAMLLATKVDPRRAISRYLYHIDAISWCSGRIL